MNLYISNTWFTHSFCCLTEITKENAMTILKIGGGDNKPFSVINAF
jgi:hypothetical protein